MIELEVATAKVRRDAMYGNGSEWYVCAAHYVHPRDREIWSGVGAGSTADEAQHDLIDVLHSEGVEAPIRLSECLDAKTRKRLIWSAKARAMMYAGLFLVEVEE